MKTSSLFGELGEFVKSCPESRYGGYSRVSFTCSKKGGYKVDIGIQPYGHANAKGATVDDLWRNVLVSLRACLADLKRLKQEESEQKRENLYWALKDDTKLCEMIHLIESAMEAE